MSCRAGPRATPIELYRGGDNRGEDEETHDQDQSRPAVLNILIVLDAFALGALAGIYAVRQVLVDTMNRLVSASAQAEILNVLDHLLPYFVGSIAAVLMLGLATVIVYLGWTIKRRASAAIQ